MKNSVEHAQAAKSLFKRLKRSGGRPTWHESENPLEQLVFAILSEGNSPTKTRTATARILAETVDYNDLRVSTPEELAGLVDQDLVDALERTRTLVRILNAIYERENLVTLENAKSRSKKETRAYLEGLNGMTVYVAGCTMLWGFGEHTVPVDGDMLEVLKKEQIVASDATEQSAEQFLKRQISAGEAHEAAAALKRYVVQKSARSRRGRVTSK